MASEAPSPIDVAVSEELKVHLLLILGYVCVYDDSADDCFRSQEIQFKLNSKFNLIQQEVNENKGNLLAAASVYGLVIVGSSEPCLKG